MKKLTAFALALLMLAGTVSSAQAQCSGNFCSFGGCPWYNHLGDVTFSYNCAWNYAGTAGQTSYNMCGWAGNTVGYISRGLFNTGGIISQAFVTSSSYQDIYSLSYSVETSNMQSGDTVQVYLVDFQNFPSTSYLVDTITTNVSCSGRSATFTNPGWKGHALDVRFIGNFSSTSTTAYVDNVAFWQKL